MKRFYSLVYSLMLVLALVVPSFSNVVVAKAADNTTKTITIFHTNDVHGRLVNQASSVVGIDYISSIKKSVPGSLLIDAGDATQGLPFANISQGADVIKLMNAAGYDGMTLGNHEFDFGFDAVLKNVKLANFPIVSANTYYQGKPLLEGINSTNGKDFIKDVQGIKVGFFGITTQETYYKTNPNNIVGVSFTDPIKTSQDEVDKLKKDGAQVIVGIMHIGNDSSSDPISDKIAENVTGIDVIIDGHSHTIENKHVNNTLIAQTSAYNANLGKIEITVTDGKVTDSKESLIPAKVAQANFTPDASVTALVKQINDTQAANNKKVIGRTATALWGGTVNNMSVARFGETNLGDLVADSMNWGASSQVKGTAFEGLPIVALENGGGVRTSILTGYITHENVIGVLPFGNILSLKVVTPNILYAVLENGVSKVAKVDPATGIISGVDGRFPQISGMRFEYDPSLTPSNTDPSKGELVTGNRVTKIVLVNADGTDGKVLDRKDTTTSIVLASNDFEVAGGDGYTMLKNLKNIGEGNALDVIFEQYLTKLTIEGNGSFFYPSSQGRTKAITTYQYKPYSATVTVSDNQGLLVNQDVTYSIDNGKPQTAKTNEKGELVLSDIPSGPHSVFVSANNLVADVFINDLYGSVKVSTTLLSDDTAVAQAVTYLIASLPDQVSLSDKDQVMQVKKAYVELTDTQKKLVTNYSKLEKAFNDISDLTTTQEVIDLIARIPDQVKLTDQDQVKKAQYAYEALSVDQKKLVNNYSKLEKAANDMLDLTAAQAVIDLIAGLSDQVKDTDQDKIMQAKKAYDELSADQKKLVNNYSKLDKAIKDINDLVATQTVSGNGNDLTNTDSNHQLANTATNIYNMIFVGAGVLLSGLVLLFVGRRKKSLQ
ncbi:bifunctional metallophosphatase/5'-nucleotidase [Neobacillus massiliamazoniensis]|uniref:Nucleotidase n=1 Tax=Neobacillus massiliamazoniensis TaxID=1499688 RepID=A0A0U1NUG7_9BACI|nr:5'-nucleotidase C-terminal domain-containing protein [Neobacillus massiliamazoniensis]CRK81699.1 nucleotidase [Neobacillus massiliamazoniensis]